MSTNYAWAANKFKLERAIKEVRGDNPLTGEVGTREVTEVAVKKVYIRLLGKVLGVTEQKAEAPEAPKPSTTPRSGTPNLSN